MSQPTIDLSLETRKNIFAALVALQDEGVPVLASRAELARKYGVNDFFIRAIEREGLHWKWSPLEA